MLLALCFNINIRLSKMRSWVLLKEAICITLNSTTGPHVHPALYYCELGSMTPRLCRSTKHDQSTIQQLMEAAKVWMNMMHVS